MVVTRSIFSDHAIWVNVLFVQLTENIPAMKQIKVLLNILRWRTWKDICSFGYEIGHQNVRVCKNFYYELWT